MILGHHDEENKCGATTITAMDIPVTYVGKFMANLQIGFPKDKLKDMHVKLNQTKTMKQQQKIKPQFCLARNRLSNSVAFSISHLPHPHQLQALDHVL